jgi:8-oxo-dGTP diphosphatase
MNQMIKVAIGVILKGDSVLLVQRSLKEGTLNWQFPAGKVESGEDPFNTAEREVFEETGIRCKATRFLGHRRSPQNNYFLKYIACEYIKGKEYLKDSRENKDVKWVKLNDLNSYIISENLFKGVAKFLDII